MVGTMTRVRTRAKTRVVVVQARGRWEVDAAVEVGVEEAEWAVWVGLGVWVGLEGGGIVGEGRIRAGHRTSLK